MTPPSAIASRAFRHRFRIASSISPRVDFDRPDVRREVHLHLDVSAQRSVEHGAHALQVRDDVDRFRIQRPAAREGQQVPGEAGAAGDGAAHRLEHARTRRPAAGALEQLQAAGEHREQVVEVVRDAAGQLAERFHLLRLAQRRFGLAQPLLIAQALGHVVDELIGADAIAVAIPQRVEPHLVGAPVARRIAELLDRGELFAGQRPAPHRP